MTSDVKHVVIILMTVLKTEKQAEIVVKKSRFISYARICTDSGCVKALIDETRALHPSASHVVHAAVIGQSEFSFSDDHEPKNTAGRPAFEVLKGSGICNICVLIVRYFGGTLLGTGGLVKAYGDSVRAVLDGIETETLISRSHFSFSIGYDLFDRTRLLLQEFDISGYSESFGDVITISGDIDSSQLEALSSRLADLSRGRISLVE